jgi:hypothetical protein
MIWGVPGQHGGFGGQNRIAHALACKPQIRQHYQGEIPSFHESDYDKCLCEHTSVPAVPGTAPATGAIHV